MRDLLVTATACGLLLVTGLLGCEQLKNPDTSDAPAPSKFDELPGSAASPAPRPVEKIARQTPVQSLPEQGQPQQGLRWQEKACDSSSFFVFAFAAVPDMPESLQVAMSGLSGLDEYRPGLGRLESFAGEGTPQATWFFARFLYPDSATAVMAAAAMGDDVNLARDRDGYHQYLWMVTSKRVRTSAGIDSVKARLAEQGLAPKDVDTDDGNVIVFYGTCLSQSQADSLRMKLEAAGKAGVVARLSFVEMDR